MTNLLVGLRRLVSRLLLVTRVALDRKVDQGLLAELLAHSAAQSGTSLKFLSESECARLEDMAQTIDQLSGELAMVRQTAANRQLSNLTAIADCDRFVSRIIQSLTNARETSEQAALTIGHHVSTLFDIARDDNEMSMEVLNRVLGCADHDSEQPNEQLSSIVNSQETCVNNFIQETRSFFERQYDLTLDVHDACADMKQCVSRINQLVFSSELLAFNVRVEALRLGDKGSTFAVLAEEMVKFSQAIKAINLDIQRSLTEVADRIGVCHNQTSTMKGNLVTFADDLSQQMTEVKSRTHELTESLSTTLSHISKSNQILMKASQEALSALQFQDPMSQDMRRTAHEVYKLKLLFENGYCEDTNAADIDPAVARAKTPAPQSGTVNWF